MARPQKRRRVANHPQVSYFKPRGIPMVRLEEVRLTVDEREALRLSDLNNLSHEAAGSRMGVSRATFGRILQKAHRVLADALINGKAIKIEGGNFRMVDEKHLFACRRCEWRWEAPPGSGHPAACPACGADQAFRVSAGFSNGKDVSKLSL